MNLCYKSLLYCLKTCVCVFFLQAPVLADQERGGFHGTDERGALYRDEHTMRLHQLVGHQMELLDQTAATRLANFGVAVPDSVPAAWAGKYQPFRSVATKYNDVFTFIISFCCC